MGGVREKKEDKIKQKGKKRKKKKERKEKRAGVWASHARTSSF